MARFNTVLYKRRMIALEPSMQTLDWLQIPIAAHRTEWQINVSTGRLYLSTIAEELVLGTRISSK